MTRKYLAVLILGIFLVSFVSAEVFTFDNRVNYVKETKTATITNTLDLFGDNTLAEIKLNTDWCVESDTCYLEEPKSTTVILPMGYQKIAEFELTNYKEYSNAFQKMEFYNLKEDNSKILRGFDYKILVTKEREKDIIGLICKADKDIKNLTETCTYEVTGTYIEKYEEWETFDYSNIPIGTYTIGIFTNVHYQDKFDWVGTFYGKELDMWAVVIQSSGSETTDGDYTIQTFTSNGYFNISGNLDVDVLVVAGGGGGGSDYGTGNAGGGGAGGYLYETSKTITGGNYVVTIGSGGNAGTTNYGGNGSNSIFNDMTSIGGGGGGYLGDKNGMNGGSGGGGGQNVGVGGSGTAGQGNNGGTPPSNLVAGGGGGGAGAVGQSPSSSGIAGAGGNGLGNVIFNGTTLWYAGGGGGGASNIAGGNGGKGGGGKGAHDNSVPGVAGTTNTGGGGGGGQNTMNAGAGGSGIVIIRYLTPSGDVPPNVVLNSPVDNFNSTTSTITFNITATDNFIIQNVSLQINGLIDQTNTSNFNGTYIFTKALSTGLTNWSILVYDNNSVSNQSVNRSVNITIISPTITLYSPTDNLVTSNMNVNFIADVTDDFKITNVSYYLDSVLQETNSSGIKNVNYTFINTLTEGSHTWYFKAYDNDSNPTDSLTRTITRDTTNPQVIITIPKNTTYYTSNYTTSNSTDIWLNWTASDINLNMCWYDNGSINIITCNSNTSLSVPFGTYNYRFYANDSVNNTHSDLRQSTYSYVYFENAHTYNPTSTETFTETFTLNLTLGSGVTLTSAYFNYNGTTYNPSLISNGNMKILSKSISIPDVSSTQNATFFWTLNSNQFDYNTTALNQTISPLSIDNCTANTIQILNYTIYNEGTRATLPAIQNTSSEISLRLGGDVKGIEYKQYNLSTTQNPISICINASLGSQNYRLDTEIQYNADDYVTEYHYLNNYTLNSSITPKNISLYLLQSTDSQEFLITYKDTNLIPIEGAYIETWRQYIGIGKFLPVEVSKTDNDGRTIGHFVLNDEIYNMYVYEKETRELKAVFQNVRAFCTDVTTGNCQINIQEQISYNNPGGLSNYLNVIGSENYNDDTKTYTFDFTTINGAKKINLTIYKYDTYLSDVVCSEEDTATSGTFTCVIPASYYNGSVMAQIYVDDELYSTNLFYVSDLQEQGLNAGGFLLAFLLIITLPLLALGSGPMTLIFFIIGLVLVGGLYLVNFGGFIGGFSAFLWLVIAGIILLIKSSKRREQ